MRYSLLCLFVVPTLIACTDVQDPSSTIPAQEAVVPERAGPGALTVATWNVYYGADLDVLVSASGLPLPVRVAQVLAQVQATDAPARAAAIARALAAAPPHLIGLQEVAWYRMQSPGDFLSAAGAVNNPVSNASTDMFDFLQLLRAALASHGLDYAEAARTTTFDVELPVYTGGPCPPCDDLRLTESVAILKRSDVVTSNSSTHLFAVNLPVSVEGFSLEIVKGWASVDATLKGRTYRFVTTHLEPADIGPGHAVVPEVHQLQLAQATQLLASLAGADIPVIITGDLNSDADGSTTQTYDMMHGEGFVDVWLQGPRARDAGFTANQAADLLNAASQLSHRIDFILYRDGKTESGGPFRGAVQAMLLGDRQADRTAAGLWPSDHAGVLATLRTAQAHDR
jgi:hypothetical protein